MNVCRSCGAKIVWVETEAKPDKPARSMPLTADPDNPTRAAVVEGGNIVIVGTSGNGNPIARYVGKGAGKHVSHFSDCPNAASHRRQR